MKAVIAVLLGLVAVTMATSSCGPLERLKVKQQWAHAYGEGHHRELLGQAIWRAFFRKAPDSVDRFFKRVHGHDIHSGEFQAHSTRVLGGLDNVISLLDDASVLDSQLTHLAGQHKARGIDATYFNTFGDILLEVIPAQLGRCFDKHAWSVCYGVIKKGIQGV